MKYKTGAGTRTLSLLLTLVMLLGMLPAMSVPALAAGTNEAGEDVFQVVLADGTQLELTEEALRAEAESHIDDEGDPVTIDGTTLTWADYKSMLAIMDLEDILNDESVQNASLYDEAHMPYTQSLMTALMGAPTLAAADTATETTVKLTKNSANSYTIDTANTTMSLGRAYNLPSYYIEDDGVENNSVSVDAEASDFTTFDSLGEVKLTVSWAGRVKDDTTGNYHATVNLTAERVLAEGATAEGTAEAVISYTIYESSGSDPVTGEITIPAGEAKKELKRVSDTDVSRIHLNQYKSGSKEASNLPGAAYVRYTPVSGCVLTTDASGNPVNGASYILGNDYNSVWSFGLQEGDVTGTQSGWRARASTFGANRMRLAPSNANDVSEINYTIKMSTLRGRDTGGATRFRLSIDTNYCTSPMTSVSDSSATMTVTVRESNSSGKVLYTATTNAGSLPSFDRINFSSMSADDVYVSYKLSSGHFNRYEQGYSNPNERLYIQAEHNLTVQVAKNSDFSAAIPAGSGDTPVFGPGDTVPILVRSTAPAVSGDRSKITATVTYNAGSTTKSETITGATAVHSDCAILFNWTMPQDCTGGTVKISNLKYGDNSSTAVDGYSEQSVNANVNYSNKLSSFDIANAFTALTDSEELAIKLPVRTNKNDWWNWIANEVGTGFIKNDTGEETALTSMYATFGSSTEHQSIYVHGDKTKETIDYAYIKLPDGQLNAVHIWVDGKEAFYTDGRYFITGLSGASVEFPVKEDALPEGQTYYTLADSAKNASGVADLRIDYDSVWNHFAGNDAGTDTVTAESVTKLIPPKYEEYIVDHNGGTPLTLSYTTAEKSATNKKYSFVKAKYFSWESSDETIATIRNETVTVNGVERVNGMVEFVGKTGEVTFTLVCTNGKHPVAITSAKLNVSDSPDPYLYVPSTSNPVVTRQGMAATVRFVTNIAKRNSSLEGNSESTPTTYSIEVKDKEGESVYTATEKGSLANPVSFITIPDKDSNGNVILNNIGVNAYTATVTATYKGDAVSLGTATSYTGEAGAYVFSATTNITVKAAHATVTMTLPKNLNGEASNFVMDTENQKVEWDVKSNTPGEVNWKYEVTNSSGTKVAGASGTGVNNMTKSWAIPKTDTSEQAQGNPHHHRLRHQRRGCRRLDRGLHADVRLQRHRAGYSDSRERAPGNRRRPERRLRQAG